MKIFKRAHKRTQMLPCRKCGGLPEVKRVGDNRDLFLFVCASCGHYEAKPGEARGTVKGAAKVWNEGAGR